MSATPDLPHLARRALTLESTFAVDSTDRDPVEIPTAPPGPRGRLEPLLGVHCAPSVLAVGYRASRPPADGERVEAKLGYGAATQRVDNVLAALRADFNGHKSFYSSSNSNCLRNKARSSLTHCAPRSTVNTG